MKVKRSFLLSLILVVLVSAWMLSGQLGNPLAKSKPDSQQQETSGLSQASETIAPMKVMVERLSSTPVTVEVVVQGQLDPIRRLDVRAETSGQVGEIAVREGQRVTEGQVLLRLSADERPARIAQARAELAQQRLNLEGARRLFERKLQSESQLKLAEAAVAAAEAGLELAEIDLERTEIRAPFNGVVETIPVELGSFIDRGDGLVELIDSSVLKAVGFVPQQSVHPLKLGQQATIRLLNNEQLDARVDFISALADTETRSFRVEALLNESAPVGAGISASIHIRVGEQQAHFVSPAALTLNTTGEVGVKVVENGGTVRFYPVSLVRTQPDGVWVGGLPDTIDLIVRGQSFVVAGQAVVAVPKA